MQSKRPVVLISNQIAVFCLQRRVFALIQIVPLEDSNWGGQCLFGFCNGWCRKSNKKNNNKIQPSGRKKWKSKWKWSLQRANLTLLVPFFFHCTIYQNDTLKPKKSVQCTKIKVLKHQEAVLGGIMWQVLSNLVKATSLFQFWTRLATGKTTHMPTTQRNGLICQIQYNASNLPIDPTLPYTQLSHYSLFIHFSWTRLNREVMRGQSDCARTPCAVGFDLC